jgi:hypothetical protein
VRKGCYGLGDFLSQLYTRVGISEPTMGCPGIFVLDLAHFKL